MSNLIHKKDKGTMIPAKIKDLIRCNKCGFTVKKNKIHQKYAQGILEIPI